MSLPSWRSSYEQDSRRQCWSPGPWPQSLGAGGQVTTPLSLIPFPVGVMAFLLLPRPQGIEWDE